MSLLSGRRLYCLLLSLTMILGGAGYVTHWAHQIHEPYQMDFGEGVVLWQAMQVGHWDGMYKPIERFPFEITHYTPLYHCLLRSLADEEQTMKLVGRQISLAAAIGVALCLGALVFFSLPAKARLLDRITAACFCVGLLFYGQISQWATFVRVDLLGLFLTFSGLTLFILSKKREWLQYVAMVLMVAGVFTKQSLVSVPLVCLAASFATYPMRAVRLAILGLCCGLVPMILLQYASHGGFLLDTIRYNANLFHIGRMFKFEFTNFQAMLPIFGMGLAAVVAQGIWIAQRKSWVGRGRAALYGSSYRRALTILSLAFLCASTVSMAVGKEGAAMNYFLEMNFLSCPLAAFAIFRWLAAWKTGRALRPATVLTGIIAFLLAAEQVGRIRQLVRVTPEDDTAIMRGEYLSLVETIRATPGLVYSDNILALLDAGKPLVGEPAIITALAHEHLWEETPLINLIRDRKIQLVAGDIDQTRWYTPEVRAAIETYDQPAGKIGMATLWRPK